VQIHWRLKLRRDELAEHRIRVVAEFRDLDLVPTRQGGKRIIIERISRVKLVAIKVDAGQRNARPDVPLIISRVIDEVKRVGGVVAKRVSLQGCQLQDVHVE